MDSNRTKIILMRHARSTWNDAQDKIYQYQKTDPELFQKDHRELTVSPDPDILNAKLNPKGLQQCEEAKGSIGDQYPNIKRVLVSPFRRAIQTFELCWENHPNFKNFKVSFIPEMREAFNSACDMACLTSSELESIKYPDLYDWGFLDQVENREFWFLDSQLDFEKERAKNAIANGKDFEQKRTLLQENLIDGPWFPWSYESKESTNERIKVSQKKVSEVIKAEGLKDGELLIVSHAQTLHTFVGMCGEGKKDWFKNCEARELNFEVV